MSKVMIIRKGETAPRISIEVGPRKNREDAQGIAFAALLAAQTTGLEVKDLEIWLPKNWKAILAEQLDWDEHNGKDGSTLYGMECHWETVA